MSGSVGTEEVSMTTSQNDPVCTTSTVSSTLTNPVPTSMLSFRFATPNNAQTPYYISSDIVLSGGIAQQNRRRIVHNEVEKRRKDKITNWIKKLGDLLPRHRIMKQSKNYVLESACEYITELNEMSSQFGPLKLSKQKLEQEVAELKNKVNKLEDENKRLSQLIHRNNVAIPTTWSDSSAITATMRATSPSRNCNGETRIAASNNSRATAANWIAPPEPTRSRTPSTLVSSVGVSSATPIVTNRLSVTSILSNTSHQVTSAGFGVSTHSAISPLVHVSTASSPVVTNTITKNVLPSTVLAVAWPSSKTTPVAPSSSTAIHRDPSTANMYSGSIQPLVVAHVQPSSYQVAASSTSNQGTVAQFPQETVPGFTAPATLRTNTVQENISQLPYSIEALTGNQTSRTHGAVAGQLLSFSAESLIGRHDSDNEMVMITNPSNQPVIENTFTLSHPTTLTNSTPHSSSPPQTFSNFSALSLVGSTTPFSVSATSTTPVLPRSANTEADATPISHSTNQMFTDFSTESLIASNEFSSDFAIDNLISRSDSNVHMAAVNPNLIQSFGKGHDPMISSVCGDHGSQSSSLHDPHGLGPPSSYLSFGSIGQTSSRLPSDQTNMPLYPTFSTILSPPLFNRSLETNVGQRQSGTVNSTNFFSSSFPTPFQVS